MTPRSYILCASLVLSLSAGCGDDASSGEQDAGSDEHGHEPDAAMPMDGAVAQDAGGSNDAGAEEPLAERAGTRLRPYGYRIGGTLVRRSIYDTELETSCEFYDVTGAGDGVLHCLPSTFTELRYTNSDCTGERLHLRPFALQCGTTLSAGQVVRAAGASECGRVTLHPRTVGAPATESTVYRRNFSTGECVEDTDERGELYVAEPLDAARLVDARIEALPTGEPGLELELLVGSDGSQFAYFMRLADDGARCDPLVLGADLDADRPCVPLNALSESDNTYADSSCSETVFTGTVDVRCDDEPEWSYGIAYADVDGCQRPSELVRLGMSVASLYVGPPESCSEHTSPPADWRSFAAAETVPFDSLPAAPRRFLGSSRLRVAHATTRAGAPVRVEQDLFDSELGVECNVRLFPDGRLRCVPADQLFHNGAYADAACTVPAYVTFVGGCNPDADRERYRLTLGEAQGCGQGPVTSVARVVRHEGPVYHDDGVGCPELTLDPSEVAFVDGEELDATTFAEVEETEP